jgi:limonene-1,2-epoxide hydrolase
MQEKITRRDAFAMAAMQGMLSNPAVMSLGTPETVMNMVTVASIEQADDIIGLLDNQKVPSLEKEMD